MKSQTLILSVRKLSILLESYSLLQPNLLSKHLNLNNSQPLQQPRLQIHQCVEEELLVFLLVGHTTRAYYVKKWAIGLSSGPSRPQWKSMYAISVTRTPHQGLSQGWDCGNNSSFASTREYIRSSPSVIDRAAAVTGSVVLSQPFPRSGGKGLVSGRSATQLYQLTEPLCYQKP